MKRKERKCDYEVHNTTPVTRAFVKWQLDPQRELLDLTDGFKLRQKYADWLDDNIKVDRIGLYYHFKIKFNTTEEEPIHIYAKKGKSEYQYVVTDDCRTIRGLKSRGFHFSAKRKRYIEFVLGRFGIKISRDALVCTSSQSDFVKNIHNMVQAILLIDGLATFDLVDKGGEQI